MPHPHVLAALGSKVRSHRERRGLSLAELAEQSGWSRRFLAEAEAGRANPSIGKLADLAHTLGIGLGKLCDLPLRDARPARYALVGMRGAGKSTLGRALATQLEVPFSELDDWIERQAGLRVAEIFELEGSVGYRRHEQHALESWLSLHGTGVLALPGGIVQSATYERVLATCRTIWLQADPEDHLNRVLDQGDTRPMQGRPDAMQRLQAILKERSPDYARCDLTVRTSDSSPRQSVDEILRQVRDLDQASQAER